MCAMCHFFQWRGSVSLSFFHKGYDSAYDWVPSPCKHIARANIDICMCIVQPTHQESNASAASIGLPALPPCTFPQNLWLLSVVPSARQTNRIRAIITCYCPIRLCRVYGAHGVYGRGSQAWRAVSRSPVNGGWLAGWPSGSHQLSRALATPHDNDDMEPISITAGGGHLPPSPPQLHFPCNVETN